MIKYLENENEFDNLIKNRVLVDFYAEWCGPCKMMGEILEDVNNIEIVKVNTDLFPDIARKYGIMSIPTLILFDEGNEIKKSIGYKSKEEIVDFIK